MANDREDELKLHFDLEVEAGIERGLTREQARRAARIRVGSVAEAMEEVRDAGRFASLATAWRDLTQGAGVLRRRPAYATVAGGALVAAVVVNTLVFTILYGVLLRPLPYPHPERLARIFESSQSQPKFPLSIYHFEENLRSARTLEAQALYTGADMQMSEGGRAEAVTAVAITDGFFPALGASPAMGRNFAAAELTQSARVVILGHSFWQRRFGGDPAILGRTVRLDLEPWTVVGITPPHLEHIGGSYRSPLQGETVDVWRPLPLDTVNAGCRKGCHYTNAIVRLKEGVSWAAADEDLNAILAALARQFPDFYGRRTVRLMPLAEEVTGGSKATILAIAIAGALVLLLAAVNIAGLTIARTLARRRELAVRLALGGSRWRVTRSILAENLVLAAAAAVVGIALTAAAMPMLQRLLPAGFPRTHEVVLRWPAGLFAVIAAALTSLAAGAAGVVRLPVSGPAEALHEDSRGSAGSRSRSRLLLVAAQMTLACVLCFGAILMLRSGSALAARSHGFDPAGVLTFSLDFPRKGYGDAEKEIYFGKAQTRLASLPGAQSAGFSTSLPWTGYDDNTSIVVDGYAPAPNEAVSARYQGATAGFFAAIGMPVVSGRDISEADTSKAPKVVVINEVLARRYFARRDPIGRGIRIFGEQRKVVGVVTDVQDFPGDPSAAPSCWMSMAQVPFGRVKAAIRMRSEPMAAAGAVRSAMAEADADLAVANVRTMESIAADAFAERNFALWWCQLFAAIALVLAAIGAYAMLAYNVEQRHREIGIRMALGASRGAIVRLVAAGVVGLAASGVALGLAASPAVGSLLGSLLYGVTPGDAASLAAAGAMILGIAIAASLAPVWRAIRTAPADVLRDQ
ncbi:MAG: ABC transporter permease [Bryobacteraceae bacterium]